jgi:hypothetical protein
VQHPERGLALLDDRHVPAQDLGPPGGPGRLGLGPGDQGVDPAEVVLDQAADDVFLGLEVVIQRGLGHPEGLGDLAQRGLLVAVLGEHLDRDGLDPGAGPAPAAPVGVLGRLAGLPGRVPVLPGRFAVLLAGLPGRFAGLAGRSRAGRLRRGLVSRAGRGGRRGRHKLAGCGVGHGECRILVHGR